MKFKVKYFHRYITFSNYFYLEHILQTIIHACLHYLSQVFDSGKNYSYHVNFSHENFVSYKLIYETNIFMQGYDAVRYILHNLFLSIKYFKH